MANKTGIQWTDVTWNPVVGCTKVSQGCKNCYAKTLHDMRHKAFLGGRNMAPQYAQPFETVQLMPDRLDAPLRWQKPHRVFVNSVSDLFHEDVPDTFIDRVFGVMARCQQEGRGHIFQVLTKRPERMRDYCNARLLGLPLANVWLGVSVENQAAAEERIPLLQQTPAAIRFLSCEPLLGPIDFDAAGSLGAEMGDPFAFSALAGADGVEPPIPGIDWVIVGGESGKNARPMDLAWVEQILADCDFSGVAAFVKQLGRVPMMSEADWHGRPTHWLLSARNRDAVPAGFVPLKLHDSHGADMAEWPDRFRVREFPTTTPMIEHGDFAGWTGVS
jgi:protein gp37